MANFKESFTKGFTTLNVKANNFVEESKCKTYISTMESEIQKLKTSIGELVYSNSKQERDLVEGVEELLAEIAKREQAIVEQEERMQKLAEEEKQILGTQNNANNTVGMVVPGRIFCAKCGGENVVGYKFCCKCGAPLGNA